MIQVNLLNRRPVIRGIVTEKDGIRLVLSVLVIVLVSAVATAFIVKKMQAPKEETVKPFVNQAPVNHEAEPVEAAATTEKVPLADSVKSVSESDTLYTRYSDMNMADRFTYEHLFAYYLFRELSIIVPSDVDFTSLSMKGYETVVGLGMIKTQESTISLFSSLKSKNWDLEPKPASLFREYKGGYQFRFEGLYKLKPAAIDSTVLPESSIPTKDHLQEMKDAVAAMIKRVPVKAAAEMETQEPVIEGKYTHYQYVLNGQSSFSQFKDLLKEFKSSKLPVSVSDAELNASGNGLAWKITIRLTVL